MNSNQHKFRLSWGEWDSAIGGHLTLGSSEIEYDCMKSSALRAGLTRRLKRLMRKHPDKFFWAEMRDETISVKLSTAGRGGSIYRGWGE